MGGSCFVVRSSGQGLATGEQRNGDTSCRMIEYAINVGNGYDVWNVVCEYCSGSVCASGKITWVVKRVPTPCRHQWKLKARAISHPSSSSHHPSLPPPFSICDTSTTSTTMSSSSPDQESVILVSNDGFQFIVKKSAACKSPTIKSMLDKRSESRPIELSSTRCHRRVE